MSVNPRFPIFIPSKGRADIAMTPRRLDLMGVPYRLVVEAAQYDDYAANYPEDRLLVIPQRYFDEHDTLDEDGDSRPKGAGPGRNFAWDTALNEGHEWHWCVDDNIENFGYLNRNARQMAGDGAVFWWMEEFSIRYTNLGMCGPQYEMFLPSREAKRAPYQLNTRIFSCQLIRCDTGLRWRGRFNEDLILSIDMLKAGWCTALFNAFTQAKRGTQRISGGYTEEFYAREGTLAKSQLAVKVHPDVVRLAKRFNRWHHVADFSKFQDMKLIRDPAYKPPESPPGFQTVDNPHYRKPLNKDAVKSADERIRAPRVPELKGRRKK